MAAVPSGWAKRVQDSTKPKPKKKAKKQAEKPKETESS
jgi:hypothetical protein